MAEILFARLDELTSAVNSAVAAVVPGLVSTFLAGVTGDLTFSGSTSVLATVNANVGTFGSATKTVTLTADAKGRITAVAEQSLTVAVGSISGLAANMATFLATPSSANLRATVTDESGTGALLFAGGALGAATATSINKVAFTSPATGSTLTIADGKTLTANSSLTLAGVDSKTLTVNNSLTFSGTDGSTLAVGVGGTITGSSSAAIFYDNVPQNSKSAAYTTVLADAQKHIFHPSADTTARIWTIDSNANVAYPIGTAITFVNQNAGGIITIAITTDTLRLAGAGTTGSRALAANGIATALKVTSTEWIISGTGLT